MSQQGSRGPTHPELGEGDVLAQSGISAYHTSLG